MKKTLLILTAVLCCYCALKAQPLPKAPNEFWYNTTDGNELSQIPEGSCFGNGLTIDFHSYTNGRGIISLSANVTMIDRN